jgi:hypothetical protein
LMVYVREGAVNGKGTWKLTTTGTITLGTTPLTFENELASHKADIAISPLNYGAKGDWNGSTGTDDTIAMQNAINAACNSERTLQLSKKYRITGGLTATKPINIIGIGNNSGLYVDSSVANNIDILTINPDTIGARYFRLRDFCIIPTSGAPARDCVRIISTQTTGINEIEISNCDFRALGGGYAINGVNPDVNPNPNGISFVNIIDSTLYGGIKGINVGDSCRFNYNNIKGENRGVDITMVNDTLGSASSLEFIGNNIVSKLGAMKISKFRNINILRNNIEQIEPILGDYIVRLEDCIDTNQENLLQSNKIVATDPTSKANTLLIKNCKNIGVYNNELACSANLDGSFNPLTTQYVIDVQGSDNIDIDKNNMYVSKGCVGVIIDSSSSNCLVGKRNEIELFLGTDTKIIDNGFKTVGVPKAPTTTWVAFSTGYEGLKCIKDDMGFAHLYGAIKPSTPVNPVPTSTEIGVLAEGYRPTKSKYLSALYMDSGGTFYQLPIMVSYQGNIITQATMANFELLSLDGIVFYTE